MDHHYFRLSLVFTKYNPYELGMDALIQEIEADSIPADSITFHTSAVTLSRYFYNRKQAEQAQEEAHRQMKTGTELELFSGYIKQIRDSMTVKEQELKP
jgi:hypothetical protein